MLYNSFIKILNFNVNVHVGSRCILFVKKKHVYMNTVNGAKKIPVYGAVKIIFSQNEFYSIATEWKVEDQMQPDARYFFSQEIFNFKFYLLSQKQKKSVRRE